MDKEIQALEMEIVALEQHHEQVLYGETPAILEAHPPLFAPAPELHLPHQEAALLAAGATAAAACEHCGTQTEAKQLDLEARIFEAEQLREDKAASHALADEMASVVEILKDRAAAREALFKSAVQQDAKCRAQLQKKLELAVSINLQLKKQLDEEATKRGRVEGEVEEIRSALSERNITVDELEHGAAAAVAGWNAAEEGERALRQQLAEIEAAGIATCASRDTREGELAAEMERMAHGLAAAKGEASQAAGSEKAEEISMLHGSIRTLESEKAVLCAAAERARLKHETEIESLHGKLMASTECAATDRRSLLTAAGDAAEVTEEVSALRGELEMANTKLLSTQRELSAAAGNAERVRGEHEQILRVLSAELETANVISQRQLPPTSEVQEVTTSWHTAPEDQPLKVSDDSVAKQSLSTAMVVAVADPVTGLQTCPHCARTFQPARLEVRQPFAGKPVIIANQISEH